MSEPVNFPEMPDPYIYRNTQSLGDACSADDVEDLKAWVRASLAAMQKELEEAKALAERLKLEAQIQAGEARAHIAIVQECYQIATGATGEPATWNGAEPIRKALTAQAERIARLEEAGEKVRYEFTTLLHAYSTGSSVSPFRERDMKQALAELTAALAAARLPLDPPPTP